MFREVRGHMKPAIVWLIMSYFLDAGLRDLSVAYRESSERVVGSLEEHTRDVKRPPTVEA